MLLENRSTTRAWKTRYAQYQGNRERKPEAPAMERLVNWEGPESEVQGPRPRGISSPSTPNHRISKRERDNREPAQGKKCYQCSRFGHIARECPSRAVRVNRASQMKTQSEDGETKMSSMIQRGRSLGMTTQGRGAGKTDLIGSQIVIPLKFLGEQCNALVDTGSMISIIPIEIVARAQDRGFDVDSLSVVPKSKLKPVFDASNNEMDFMGAVYIQVETEGGRSELIAFHISPAKEAEVIIGTNALNKLGVEVSIDTKSRVNTKVDEESKKTES
ncbi:zinc knuckle [Ostertagia ostertagi]